MHIDRVHADRYLAFLGFALSFLFLLAIVAFAFTVTNVMDYAMPRATDLPTFETTISEVPSTTHPLGLRGGGEGGITPALGVIANAIVDGLREFGVTHVDLPATPERIWRAIQ